MNCLFLIVMIDEDNKLTLEVRKTGEEAEKCAVSWLNNLYPSADVWNVNDIREFEETHSILVDFYVLDADTLEVEEA